MKAVALLLVALALAGCAKPGYTYRELDLIARDGERSAIDRPAPDTCQMAQHQSLIGRDGTGIDQTTLPTGARVVCFNCAVTMDFSAQRLNVMLGADGKVESLRCG
jgi:hypothetical protein